LWIFKTVTIRNYEKWMATCGMSGITEILDKFSEERSYAYEIITPEIAYLIRENILFSDPVKCIIKPQSQLDLLALREMLKSV